MIKFRHTIAALLALFLAVATASAQEVIVTVTPTQTVLPPQVTLYVTEPANYFNVSLSNTGKDAASVYLVLQIEQVSPASTLGVSTPPRRQPSMPIVVPAGGTRILTPGEVRGLFNHVPLKEVQAPAGLFDEYLNGTFGLLPEGQYEAHMTAYRWDPNLTEPVVASSPTGGVCYFTVCYKAQAPEFITPVAGNLYDPLASPIGELDPLAPIFTWKAPVLTCNPALIQYTYSLRIVEVLPGQAPDNSMDLNPVVYQISNLSSAQCLIPMPVIKQLSDKKTYAAQVTATASNTNNRMLNYVSINNNGKSTYCLFRLKSSKTIDDNGEEEVEEDEEIEDLKKELGEDDEDEPVEDEGQGISDVGLDIWMQSPDALANITDSLYNFRNPRLISPVFSGNDGARKVYLGSQIIVKWSKPLFAGGEGQRSDTINIEYDVQVFNNGERPIIEEALETEPIYNFHTKELNDTIDWDELGDKAELGDYLVLRVKPTVKEGESVAFIGDGNTVDFAVTKRLSKEYFQCEASTVIDNMTPTTKAASDFKDKTVAIGEYRLTIDEIKGSGEEGFSGKGRVEWTPFGAKIMVCVKFSKLKINTQDVVYDGIAEAETATEISGSKQAVDKLFSDWGMDNLMGNFSSQLQSDATGAVKSLAEQINLSQYYKTLQEGTNIGKLITTGGMDKLYMPVRFPKEVLPPGFDVVDLQIADMKFAPTYATMNIIGESKMPECDVLKDKLLVFGAPRVCISPNSFLPADGHIALLGNFTITPSSDIDITFKAPTDVLEPKNGCYISWHQGKLELLGIDADMKVEGLVKDVGGKPSKERPVFHLQASFGSWDDFLVEDISIEDFQVEDLPGYTFSAENVSYDHSAYRNSKYMPKFPDKYSKKEAGCAGADEEWQGLSIGKVGVAFPKSLQLTTKSEKGDYRLWVGAEGMLIDKSGLTLSMGAEKVLQAKEGTLGGWGISLDKAKMQIVQDQFDNCMFAGQLNIPVFDKATKDEERFGNVDYTCEIRRFTDPRKDKQGQTERTRYSYVFLTEQVDDLDFSFLLAKASLDKDQTYFVMEAVDDEKDEDKINTQVELCLGGTLGIGLVDDANDWLKEKTKKLPLEVKIPDIHFTKMRLSNVARGKWTFTDERVKQKIKTREAKEAAEAKAAVLTLVHSDEMKLGDDCYLDLGEWSLASAKKRLGPFSFNLKKFTPSYKNGKINLEVEGGIGLCDDKINVDGGIAISSKVTKGKKISDWSLGEPDVKFRKLELDLDFTALHFKGSLEAKNDGTDKGYSGELDVSLIGMFTVKCAGGYYEHEPDDESKKVMAEEDPETKNLSDDDRKYAWGYFMVSIGGGAGIHADPVVINRISGGFFFNCRPTQGDDKFTGTPVADYGMIGVALGIGLSTTAGESALSADLDLLVVYDRENDCLSTFMFNGKVQAVSGIIKAKASLVYENQKNSAGVTQNRYLVLNVTVEAGFDSASLNEQMKKINATLESLKGTLNKFQGNIEGVYKQAASSVCGMKGLKDGNEEIPDDADPEASADASPDASSGKAKANSSGFVAGKTVISLEFMVTWAKNGTTYKTPKWHLYLGEPEWDNRCSFTLLKFDGKIVNVDIGANAYICLGNELPNGGQLPAIPAEITSFLSGNKSGTTDMDADLGRAERSRAAAAKNLLNPNSCEGGIMVGAAAWGKIEVDLGLLYGKMGAIAGFDAALVNYGNNAFCMNSGSPMGKHGWYAMGQLYAYLYAELGVRIRIGKLINKDWPFFDFGIGGVLEVGLPNPTWVEGKARVKLSLLGGLWKINKKFSFAAGDHCVPFRGNALDGFEMFQGVSHGSDSLYQALMDPTFAISASDANRMTFTTQASIGAHYRLEDPTAMAEMSEATGATKDSLGLHASRTYVFDMDQRLNKNNMKMGVRLFDLGTMPTKWIEENGGPLSENAFYTKMGRTSEKEAYENMREFVSSYFDNRGKTVCETSVKHASRDLNSASSGYLRGDSHPNTVQEILVYHIEDANGKMVRGVRSWTEENASFREDKGTTFHLTNMNLKPGHSYVMFLMADAYEIENGHRVWCTYVDNGAMNYINWRQTKAWFFRVKSEKEEKIISDSIRTLEPYVALAYPSIDGTRVRDDRGEGAVPAYFTDIMHPTIALNRDISGSLPVSKLKWKLTAYTADGDTIQQTRNAKYVKGNNCINLEPETKFSRMYQITNKISTAAKANKTYDYSTEQYHLQLEYGPIPLPYPDEETGETWEMRNLVDLWLTTQPHDVTIAGYDTTQDDSWRQTTTKATPKLLAYSYPFVGATIDKAPVLAYEKDYKSLTDEDIVFKNRKFSLKEKNGNTVSAPYRLVDPYLYFAYLSKWVFIGDRAIDVYSFDDCNIPYGSESLIFTYNGTVVNAEFLQGVKNKSLIDVRKQMYDVWNDWNYNNSNMPKYPLPMTTQTVGGVTVANQDGKCSTVTPVNLNHYKDMTYCFEDLVKDFVAPTSLASSLCAKLCYAASDLPNKFFYHWWLLKHHDGYNFDNSLNVDIWKWNKLHRGQYLSFETQGFEVKVPYYQLPLIYGNCFGDNATYNGNGLTKTGRTFEWSIGQGDMTSGDAASANLSKRWSSEASNLLFFRLSNWADGRFKAYDTYPFETYKGCSNSAYSASYRGTTGSSSRQVDYDLFETQLSLKACTEFKARIYRVDSYDLTTGLYTLNNRGGGPWEETVTIDANNKTAGDMAEMNRAIIDKSNFLRTHYDKPRIQVFHLIDGAEQTLKFIYSDSIYTSMAKLRQMWINENDIEALAWHNASWDITKVEFDKSMKEADLRTTKQWFYGFRQLTQVVGANNLDTKNVTDMAQMFYNCPKLTSLDLSKWDTGNVENMMSMFAGCESMKTLSQNFNTSKVKSMSAMFHNCKSLISFNFNNFTSEKLESTAWMFLNCTSMKELFLKGLEGEKLTNTSKMFNGCTSLKTLLINAFTPKDENIKYSSDCADMFKDVPSSLYSEISFDLIDRIRDQLPGNRKQVYNDNYKAIYALDKNNEGALIFINNATDYAVGNTYTFMLNGVSRKHTVKNVWKGKDVMNTSTLSADRVPWNNRSYDTKNIYIDRTFTQSPQSTAYWFSGFSKAEIEGIANLRTHRVTNMKGMFQNCSKLTKLHLNSQYFQTQNVTDMSAMFSGCSSLYELYIHTMNTSKVTNMRSMFRDCKRLTQLDTGWDYDDYYNDTYLFNTANVTDLAYMFYGCSSLKRFNGGNWGEVVLNTSKATDMSYMFYDCTSYDGEVGNNFDMSNVTTASYMFYNNQKRENISVVNTDKLINTTYMFYGCSSAASINMQNSTFPKVTQCSRMFQNVNSQAYIYLPYNANQRVLDECNGFANLILMYPAYAIKYKVAGEYEMRFFSSSNKYKVGDKYNGYTIEDVWTGTKVMDVREQPEWKSSAYKIVKVTIEPSFANVPLINCNSYFRGMEKITSITGLQYMNMKNVKDMAYMFYGCEKLTSLDLSSWNTASATNMERMFEDCKELKTLNISKFNTSNVTSMRYMFSNCRSLESLNLKSFNTEQVTAMSMMFYGCSLLTSLDLSSFNTPNLTNIAGIFTGLKKVKSLKLDKFDFSQLANVDEFSDMESLEELDLSNANTAAMRWFSVAGCKSLRKLTLGNRFTVDKLEKSSLIPSFKDVYDLIVICPAASLETIKTAFVDKLDFVIGTTGQFYDKMPDKLAQAVYTSGNATLAFLYSAPVGSTYDGERVTAKWSGDQVLKSTSATAPWDDYNYNIITVVFEPSFASVSPTSTKAWFKNFLKLEEIKGLKNLNTKNVTDMSYMFYRCSELKELDLSNFNTEKVTDMSYMFSQLTVEDLDLSKFNTAKVTDMSYMFSINSLRHKLDLSNFNMTSVTKADYMFNRCELMTTLRLGQYFTLPRMTGTASYCFNRVPKKMEVEVHSNYMSSVKASVKNKLGFVEGTNGEFVEYDKKGPQAVWTSGNNNLTFYYGKQYKVGDTFVNGYKVTNVWSGSDVTNAPRNSSKVPWTDTVKDKVTIVQIHSTFAQVKPSHISCWFAHCQNLRQIYGTEYLNTSNVWSMYKMCYDCANLTTFDVSKFDTQKVQDMSFAFYGCERLAKLDVVNWNTEKVTTMSSMFSKCKKIDGLNMGIWKVNKVQSFSSMFYGCESLTGLDIRSWNTASATSMSYMFHGCSKLSYLVLSKFDTSNVTTMKGMFAFCSFTNTPYSNFNTKSCTDMSYMFYKCSKMKEFYGNNDFIDNSSKVTDMSYMFADCTSMTCMKSVRLNTTSVTNMSHMFDGCSGLTRLIEVSNFNTSNVTNMSYMFRNCSATTSILVDKWNTSKVTDMSYMFQNCSNVSDINVVSWKTANVTNMAYLFSGCTKIAPDVSNWNVSKVKSFNSMFEKTNVKDLYLANWNPSACSDISYIFYQCSGLKKVTLGQNFTVPSSATNNGPFGKVTGCSLYIYNTSLSAAKTLRDKLKFTSSNGKAYYRSNGAYAEIK